MDVALIPFTLVIHIIACEVVIELLSVILLFLLDMGESVAEYGV